MLGVDEVGPVSAAARVDRWEYLFFRGLVVEVPRAADQSVVVFVGEEVPVRVAAAVYGRRDAGFGTGCHDGAGGLVGGRVFD